MLTVEHFAPLAKYTSDTDSPARIPGLTFDEEELKYVFALLNLPADGPFKSRELERYVEQIQVTAIDQNRRLSDLEREFLYVQKHKSEIDALNCMADRLHEVRSAFMLANLAGFLRDF